MQDSQLGMLVQPSISIHQPYKMPSCIVPVGAPCIIYKFIICDSVTRKRLPGFCFECPQFSAGGLKWVLQYFPNGLYQTPEGSCSLFLKLVSNSKHVKASVQFEIAPQNHVSRCSSQRCCKLITGCFGAKGDVIGIEKFMQKKLLEKMILSDVFFEIICSLKVIEGSLIEADVPVPMKDVPRLNLVTQLSQILNSGEIADVTFSVQEHIFPAHRSILAARSPVFKAQFFGPMFEANNECINVDEMNPIVFNALLQYIYTDSITEGGSECEIILDPRMHWATFTHHLLAAADLYDVEGLRKICEEKVSKEVRLEAVIDVLSFADSHSFELLKDACCNLIAKPENFMALACTQGYMQVMLRSPALLAKMQEKLSRRTSITPDSCIKKQKRTN